MILVTGPGERMDKEGETKATWREDSNEARAPHSPAKSCLPQSTSFRWQPGYTGM